jgi:hypothetical protein
MPGSAALSLAHDCLGKNLVSQAEYEAATERTYRAIGCFFFEFSQVEYMIRYYLAQEIGLKEEHFSPVIESYDIGVLCVNFGQT